MISQKTEHESHGQVLMVYMSIRSNLGQRLIQSAIIYSQIVIREIIFQKRVKFYSKISDPHDF